MQPLLLLLLRNRKENKMTKRDKDIAVLARNILGNIVQGKIANGKIAVDQISADLAIECAAALVDKTDTGKQERKFVQISAMTLASAKQYSASVVALADDGTIWESCYSFDSGTWQNWSQLPAAPQSCTE